MSKTINDVIEEYCKKKLPPSEILRLMKEVVSHRGVYKAVKRFKDTGTCAPRIRSDPERTVRTKKLIKKVREKLRRNPARSARQLAKDYSVACPACKGFSRMISRATHTSSPKDISCRRPLRRKGSIEQRFWSRNLSMARSLKFYGQTKNFSLFKLSITIKMTGFGFQT